jgi:DNA-binding winged helix-turn-helix (wHTH) protein
LHRKTWTIPACRMKAGREHRVPLSERAALLILSLRDASRGDLIFPSVDGLRPLSRMMLLIELRRIKPQGPTVHGFRSTFRDWIAERTEFPGEVAEMALAHTVRNQVEAAYRRGDLFEKRRQLMEAWSAFALGQGTAKHGPGQDRQEQPTEADRLQPGERLSQMAFDHGHVGRDPGGGRAAFGHAGREAGFVEPGRQHWEGQGGPVREVVAGPLRLAPASRLSWLGDHELNLTVCEFDLLLLLASRPGEVLTKDELFECVLHRAREPYDRSIDVHVSNVRQKLARAGAGVEIKTARAFGYRLTTHERGVREAAFSRGTCGPQPDDHPGKVSDGG